MPQPYTVADRVLAMKLGLGDPVAVKPVCMTYACACVCPDCLERASSGVVAPEQPAQPWQIRPARQTLAEAA